MTALGRRVFLLLTVAALPLVAQKLRIETGPNLPGGTVNQPYLTNLSASGGTAPYGWEVTDRSLLHPGS